MTSYSRGINGIVIDIEGSHPSITASDFILKVGNNNSPSTWTAAPAPSAVSVRAGAGLSGADRVEITWADGAIQNAWLEVQVLANANTGLADSFGGGVGDVFFWGNKVADGTGDLITSVGDAGGVFVNFGVGTVTNVWDYNKTGVVSVADAGSVFFNLGALAAISIPTGGPFAPEGGGGTAAPLASEAAPSLAKVVALPAMLSQSTVDNPTLARVAAPSAAKIAVFPLGLPRSTTPLASSAEPQNDAAHSDLVPYRPEQVGPSNGGDRPGMVAAAAWHSAGDDGDVEGFEWLDDDLLDLLAADLGGAPWRLR